MNCSTITVSSNSKAFLIASSSSSRLSALYTPTLEPPQFTFAIHGYASHPFNIDLFKTLSFLFIVIPLGVGIFSLMKSCFETALSIAIALEKYPVPVYLILRRSNIACILPSSPFCP